MMIEEYKETVLHELEAAGDCREAERVIDRSIEQFPEEDLYRFMVIIYLHILQDGLEKLSGQNVDLVKKRNIRHALSYLKQMNSNRKKWNNK